MSKDTKWTPGPWGLVGLGHRRILGVASESDHSFIVVPGFNDDPYDAAGVRGKGADEAKANANLIAAAPELYEALIRVQQEGGMGIGLHRQIDRVLAKARGEQ